MLRKYIVSIAQIENPERIKDSTVMAESALEAVYKTEKTGINPYREKVIAAYPYSYKDIPE